MKIDRSNYEIWFIDWLEEKLDSHQVDQLNRFLDENPDLREEFYDLKSINIISIDPLKGSFTHKENLKKHTSDISDSQFDLLCVAFLENDLSVDQKSELMEMIDQDSIKKKNFELIQKTRISPESISYKNKYLLFRRTAMQKYIRLSVIGLSAAAAIALLITTYLIVPRNASTVINNTALLNNKDTTQQIQSEPALLPEKTNARRNLPAKIKIAVQVIALTEMPEIIRNDSGEINFNRQEISVNKISFSTQIGLQEDYPVNSLISYNAPVVIQVEDDGRSNIGKFISKTFREIILKENYAPDSPLKGYEIAEAGVTGINKLLGWEMALDKNNDENGDLNSVNFNSRLLKFNAPVKKSEPLP